MFSDIQALVLGIVQGLTEFLPVSSSAHLVIVPWLFGWQDPGLAFDVALHLGTLVALIVYYWRRWLSILASIFTGDPKERALLVLLIVASVPGAVFGFLLEKKADEAFRSPILIAAALAAMGTILWIVDRRSPQKRKMGEISILDAILIGLAQAFALVPGVSRSGVTITAARALGVKREDAANFSFLMATPIIAGAGILKARELIHGTHHGLGPGFIASAAFGLLAIAVLISFVRTRSYAVFAWYRIAAAVFVAAIYFARS